MGQYFGIGNRDGNRAYTSFEKYEGLKLEVYLSLWLLANEAKVCIPQGESFNSRVHSEISDYSPPPRINQEFDPHNDEDSPFYYYNSPYSRKVLRDNYPSATYNIIGTKQCDKDFH